MLQKIGRYQLKSQLGRGRMATVYHAFDPGFQREVAIKVLPPEFLRDATFRTRFEREARTIAALEHPAIVPVYDVGEEDELLYLVMRLMSGGTLSDRLKERPLPIDEIAQIIKRIGSALDEAHKQGVIHRDLKPANILFDRYNDAYLSDFGIARSIESEGTLTGLGGAIGTPGYMSPEQIQGTEIDNRSDIYALGVMVFEMLTGQNPFKADTPAMTMVKQMTESLPSVYEIKPNVPPEVDIAIQQATTKERADRTPTAAEVARLLAQAAAATTRAAEIMATKIPLIDEPTETMPGSEDKTELSSAPVTSAAPPPHTRRNTWLIGGAAVILAALIGFFLFNTGPVSQPAEIENGSTLPPLETPVGEAATHTASDDSELADSTEESTPAASAAEVSTATPTPRPTYTPRPTIGPTPTVDANPTYTQLSN